MWSVERQTTLLTYRGWSGTPSADSCGESAGAAAGAAVPSAGISSPGITRPETSRPERPRLPRLIMVCRYDSSGLTANRSSGSALPLGRKSVILLDRDGMLG